MPTEKGTIIVKDNTGKYFRTSKLNPLYLNGEFKHMSTGTLVVKDINGFKFRVKIDDDRIKTGELIPINKGKRFTQNIDCKKQLLFTEKCKKLYPNFSFELRSLKTNFLIKYYCKHGDIVIKKKEFIFIYKNSNVKIYCEKCREEYILNLIQTNEQHNKNRELFEKLSKGGLITHYFNKNFLKTYFPEIFNSIDTYSTLENWTQKIYNFRNKINVNPVCEIEKCCNETEFSNTAKHYNIYCEKHKHTFNISNGEKELLSFITNNYNGKILQNDRSILNGREIDIYLPEINLAFEYNGLYNHSSIFKNNKYHYEKWKKCNDNGIELIFIWEDDWKNKSSIIKSIILNKLNIHEFKIGARETEIREISYNEAKDFLYKNHIQSYCPSSIRLALIYKNEIVSIMTFGKNRMILKSKSKEQNEYELLRYCNRLNTSIIGGASKLFKYFIDNYFPKKIISYSSLDYFNGNLYTILGFTNIRFTGPGYWWAKDGIKYNRSNFMKHKISNKENNKTEDQIMMDNKYIKIYNSGNIKWEYENHS